MALELFTRVICHDSALPSKKSALQKLSAEFFQQPCADIKVSPYWKEPCFSVMEASIVGEAFALAKVADFVACMAGKPKSEAPRFLSGEVTVACYASIEEMNHCKSLAFVDCSLLE